MIYLHVAKTGKAFRLFDVTACGALNVSNDAFLSYTQEHVDHDLYEKHRGFSNKSFSI